MIIYSNPNSGPSTPRSGDWDHYTEQPSFWNSRFGWITQQNGIQLVNTESESLSSLEVDQSLAVEINNIVSDYPSDIMSAEQLSRHISELKKLFGAIKAEITLFSPSDLTEAAVGLVQGHLDSVKQLYVNLSTAVDVLEESFGAEVAVVQEWRIKLNSTRDLVSTNRRELMEKKSSFTAPPVPAFGNVSTASIESHMSVLRLNEEKALSDQLAKAEDEYRDIIAEIDSLLEDMKEHFESSEEIKEKDDSQVRIAMIESSDWKKRKQEISKSYRKYSSLVDRLEKALLAETEIENGMKDAKAELETLKADKEDLETKFDSMEEFADSFLKELRAQDTARALHSKDSDKAIDVEWPRFAGKDFEDFAKFKDKLERAFKLAKVSRDMKVDKLRMLLSGHAKDLVPDTVKNLDEAYKLLDEAFGDPSRLVDFKLKVLGELGQLPSSEKKGGYKAQISFYIKLQGVLEDLIALGSKNEDLASLAFHRSTSHTLANRFPANLRNKLILKHSKLKGKAQLTAMLETIKQ